MTGVVAMFDGWLTRQLILDGIVNGMAIGLVSMGAPGDLPEPFTARFDHVRVWALR